MYRDNEIVEDTISTITYSQAGLNAAGINNIKQLVMLLENPQQFKIIQKYQKPDFYKIDDSAQKKIGVFLDTETTGLSCHTNKILELGMIMLATEVK